MSKSPASLTGRFLKAGTSSMVQMASAQGTTFLVNLILGRSFGPLLFGILSTTVQTLNAVGQTSQLATAAVGSRFLGQNFDDNRPLALAGWRYCRQVGLVSGLAASLLLLALAPFMASQLGDADALTNPLRLAAAAAFFFVACQQTTQALFALEAIRVITILSVITGVVYTTLTIAGGLNFGVQGAVLGIAAAYMVQWLLLSRPERQMLPAVEPRFVLGTSEKKSLISQLVPASISGILLLPSTWLLLTLVTREAGPSQAGIYAAATQLRLLLMILPQIINSAGIVIINRNARGAVSRRTDMLAGASLVGSGFFTMVLGFVCTGFLTGLFGKDFGASAIVLRALLPAILFECIILWARQVLQKKANFWEWLICVTVPWQSGTLAIAYFLIPTLGAKGAAIGYSGGLLCGLLGFGLRFIVRKISGKE